jgi:phospholipase/carboxylesterase
MTLEYLIKKPKNLQASHPLIVLLHGYGSNEQDLFSFASELPDDAFIISFRAPYDLMHGSYAWYAINFDADENKFSDLDQARASRDLIMQNITQILAQYPININDITLIGFSQGAILSYAIALSYPQKIKQIVALSGYVNQDIMVENFKSNNFSKLRIFASHGWQDQVIPVDWARKTPDFLKKLGIEFTYKEYAVAHGVAPQNFFDFKAWM